MLNVVVSGAEMTEAAIEALRPAEPHRFVFVVLRTALDQPGVRERLRRAAPNGAIVPVERATGNPLATLLLARRYIGSSDPLIVVQDAGTTYSYAHGRDFVHAAEQAVTRGEPALGPAIGAARAA